MAALARAEKSMLGNTASPGSSQPAGVFGSLEFRTNATKGLDEWRNLLKRLAKEEPLYKECDAGKTRCPSYLRDWRDSMKSWAADDTLKKLAEVNSYINGRILYTDDGLAFGRSDVWATPAMSLKGRGDCEDYAIAKYETLRAMGFPEDSMRLVIVDDTRRKLGHAVLTVNTNRGLYVLDNLKPRPYLDGIATDYAPIYSVNRTGRWINIATRRLRPAVVASRSDEIVLAPVAELRPTLPAEDDSISLRPSLATEPATGTGPIPGD
jgi:predicted transglutaminase-like cysteine proteinase